MSERLWHNAEIIVTIIQSFIIGKFLADFNEFKLKTKSNRIRYLIVSLTIAVTIILFNYIGGNFEGWIGLFYPILYLVMSVIFFKGRFLFSRKLFGALAAISGVLIANTIVLILLGTILRDSSIILSSNNILRVIALVLNQVILFMIFKIILKFVFKQQIKLSTYEWMIISVFMFFSLGTYISLFTIKINENLSNLGLTIIFCVLSGLILVDCVTFYMVFKLNKINEIDNENKRLKEFYSAEQKYGEAVKTQYEELQRIRHDIKQLVETISVIAISEKSESILNVLDSQKILLEKNDIIEATDNIYVNAILTAKISEARAKSIKVNLQMTKNIHGFDGLDLCYLLGNLLDNAIEACDKCTNPSIYIKLITNYNAFEITIKNSIPPDYLMRDLKTSKADNENHGFGIKSIRHIADKYNGLCDFYTEDDFFISFVLLKTA